MQKTWAGINSLINRNGRCSNSITFLRYPNGALTHNPFEIPNILNNYFTSVGPDLASKISQSNRHFSEYLPRLNNYFTSVGPNLASKISQSNRHFSEYLPRLNSP